MRFAVAPGPSMAFRQSWDVYVEGEGSLGPRDLALSRRQAVALAYAVSVAKRQDVVITPG